ncbi:MAG: hypothetical protein GY713_08985 [Actinomycetia bacterium]|nr:hypothetical protein [Actinomycetes bacterium]
MNLSNDQVIIRGDGAAEAVTIVPGEGRLTSAQRRNIAYLEQQAAERGHAEGFKRGMEEGHEQGLTSSRAEVHTALDGLDAAAGQLKAEAEKLQIEMDDKLLDLALEVVQVLLDRELEVAEHLGNDALRRALRVAPPVGDIRARLNPIDLAALAGDGDPVDPRVVELVADHSLDRGDCMLEVGSTLIDARISTALARFREALQP